MTEHPRNTAAHRLLNRPTVRYESVGDLPILAARREIIAAIRSHQVLVVCGETGSGKSTQLPKFCLEAGLGLRGLIGHTQPRRIAARSIARRLADELQSPLGQAVGYKIRFTDQTSDRTLVKLMTDGILLAETQTDRLLNAYEALIIDEAHERSLNIDFLLGILTQLLPRRPELRLIVTSATIDAERFAAHFASSQGPAPIIHVSGRSYPVEVRYRPLIADDVQRDEARGIVDALRELWQMDAGHVLVFLPTERDILETHKHLRGVRLGRDGEAPPEVLPLYARLSNNEQNRIYQPTAERRIILATNVAESSLTIPGIRYVIDTGTARISRYAARSKVQRLPIEAVSRASADQRKGRCGRLADGVCIRLYAEEDYAARPAYTTPEIQRTNLASVILRAKVLQLGPIEEFPFLDPPRHEAIADGYRTLFEIGAIDPRRELTKLGKRLAKFPVDPRIARIIVAADQFACLSEMLIIASALEIQDPRERPLNRQQQADEAHARFADEQSDFLGLLRLWDFYHDLKQRLSRNQLQKACQANFLSHLRMREWTEIHLQLLQLVTEQRMKCHPRRDDLPSIHRALLTGFLSGIAYRSGDFEYTGAGGVKFFLWPGSALFNERPVWCLVGELIETRRRYGRMIARIQPEWVEPLAAHLIKRRYDDPHWHRKSGRVMAWENVTLFGLPIVQRRRVPYSSVNAEEAHDIFVRDGLGRHDVDCAEAFFRHNLSVVDQCQQLSSKSRDAKYLVDEYALHRFYHERVPADVYDLLTLRNWLRVSPANVERVRMNVQDFVDAPTNADVRDPFPEEIVLAEMRLPVQYQFTPGEPSDGATVKIPIDGLAKLTPGQLEWGVPGHRLQKTMALIRSLPKSVRRGLIPVSDTARRILAEIETARGDFLATLAGALSQVANEPITPAMFMLDKVPPHLRLNLQVVDNDGTVLAEGRDVTELRKQLPAGDVRLVKDIVEASPWSGRQITEWDFDELPRNVNVKRSGIEVAAFPSLVDQGDHVLLQLASTHETAERSKRAGVRRLFALRHAKAIRAQVNWLPRFNECCVWAFGLLSKEELQRQVGDLIAERAVFQQREKVPHTKAEFEERSGNATERIGIATQDVARLLPRLFEAYHQARLALEELAAKGFAEVCRDINSQMASLMGNRFLVDTPWNWLSNYPRYLRAIVLRIERTTSGGLPKDRERLSELSAYWQRYTNRRDALDKLGQFDPELEMFRWMMEEYRVSCFAQSLGTSISVSPQRLEKQWARTQAV